jgi:hypothetical protein
MDPFSGYRCIRLPDLTVAGAPEGSFHFGVVT